MQFFESKHSVHPPAFSTENRCVLRKNVKIPRIAREKPDFCAARRDVPDKDTNTVYLEPSEDI